MKEWLICGNKILSGTVKINGAKNALLPILIASIITKSVVYLDNVSPLKDTYVVIRILKKLNVRVLYDNKSKMIIDSRNVKNTTLICDEMKELRASYYFMGALLSMYKEIKISGPGGCKFASRPIDLHLHAFEKLGFSYSINESIYTFKKVNKSLKVVEFSKVSVGATINAILASCRINGVIRLVNVALEPEIDDLIDFLNKCGAVIRRVNDTIVIKGVKRFKGCEHKIIQDRIEAGTYLIIGACVGKNLIIEYENINHLKSLIDLLCKMNVEVKTFNNKIMVSKVDKIKDENLIFDVYPNLPTDLQQPLSILLTKCDGFCVLKDKIYPSRYTQIEDLTKMGFKMEIKKDCLYVYSSVDTNGNEVYCKDLRGGASLVVASLLTKGITTIKSVEHINRGYYDMINKLRKIGAIVYEKN